MSQNDPLVEFRLDKVEEAILALTKTTEQLARIDERLVETRSASERAFGAIKELTGRVSAIEAQLPELKRASGWVYVAAAAVVGAAFALVWRSATLQPRPIEPPAAAVVQRAEGHQR